MLVYNTNYGQRFIRWFEYYGQRFERAGSTACIPRPPSASWTTSRSRAASQQMLRLVAQLETVAGRKLDIDRLAEVVR